MRNLKLKGKFYTPDSLAEWIAYYLSKYFNHEIDALEPSCGAGAFIKALDNSMISVRHMDAVEVEQAALNKNKPPKKIKHLYKFKADFLFWQPGRKYDLVIGNPPYIVRKLLTKKQSDECKQIHTQQGLLNHEVANIWTSFLLKSAQHLNDDGVLAFVLPTEILQVKYAKEIRSYLAANFRRIEVITFKQLAFDGIDQDTVVLFAYKNPIDRENGIFMIEVDGVEKLSNTIPSFTHLPSSSLEKKWTTGLLQESEILLMEILSSRVNKASHYCASVAGIVTGANDFFIVNKNTAAEYDLISYSKKIIKKSTYINNCVDFTNSKFQALKNNATPCYLLDTNKERNISGKLRTYLKLGESLNIQERYKSKLRQRWHDVPNIKKGEGFFFKRSYEYPKCVKNSANVFVTDSAYQIVMNSGFSIDDFIYSFYNSLTLLAAEMQGRYYGGGVLELTPNEFKSLPIPYSHCENFAEFSARFEGNANIEEILESNDQLILVKGMGISEDHLERIRMSYKKMRARRMKKSTHQT